MYGIAYLISMLRDPQSAVKTKPSHLVEFRTPLSLYDVRSVVTNFARQNGYKIEDVDEDTDRIILSTSPNWSSWGYFYPIYLTQTNGETLIEVGIKSRLFVYGSIRTRHLERCVNGIKASIHDFSTSK
ncbi:MAG: hypothetical protein ACFFDT_24610 [Candidatus Hodarchaeota archaeon]